MNHASLCLVSWLLKGHYFWVSLGCFYLFVAPLPENFCSIGLNILFGLFDNFKVENMAYGLINLCVIQSCIVGTKNSIRSEFSYPSIRAPQHVFKHVYVEVCSNSWIGWREYELV